MLTNLWPVRHRSNRSRKMQPATTVNVAGKWCSLCRIHHHHHHHLHLHHHHHHRNHQQFYHYQHKCFIWIVAWLSLFAALTQAQVNLYSAPLQQHKQQTSNTTSAQSTSAPFKSGASNSSPLQLAAVQGNIPLGAISNSAADCGANEFQCKSDHLCIPLARVADGLRDCADGSDECDNESQFRCRCGSPVCIDRVHVLDGQIHCEDGSDEGLESTGAGCMSNELSAGMAAFSDGKAGPGKQRQPHEEFVDTGQMANSEKSAPVNPISASFVEFTGTFLPFAGTTELTPFHYYPVPLESSSTESVIEITGTFIPEQVISSASTATAPEISSTTESTWAQAETTTEKLLTDAVFEDVDGHSWFSVRGINQTYMIGGQIVTLLTSTNNGLTPQGLLFACARSRFSRTPTNCKDVPLKVTVHQESNTDEPSSNQSLMLVDVLPEEVVLKIFCPRGATKVSDRVKRAQVKLGKFHFSGVAISGIKKIDLNRQSQHVPISVKEYVDFKINISNAAERNTVEIVDMRTVELRGSKPAAADISSSGRVLPASAVSSSAVSTVSRKHMRTHTVGNLNGHFSSALVPGALTKSLQSYFSNRLIPTYSPTKIDPTVAIVVAKTKSVASTSTTPAIRATSTIFGFIDFTTVVNNTLLIFTPKVKAEISSTSKMIARIEPTRAAIFHDFVSSTTATTTTTTGSSMIDPLFEIDSTGQQEALPIASRSSSSTYEASKSGASHQLITSPSKEKGETEPLEISSSSSFNEFDSSMAMSSASVSGITTITSGFILPSFSSTFDDQQLQSASTNSDGVGSSSIAATPDVSTVAKTAVFSINETANESSTDPSSSNSGQITSSSVLPVDSSDDRTVTVQPTRPLKTFYTTYTYYTTFKDAQTQFVHSRKEVVTNVVDEREMQQQISASSASSQQTRSSIQSTSANPASSMDLIDSSTVSPVETAKLSSTPSELASSMKSNDAASTGASAPLNKSYLGKLLSGIAVPITHYTTFTYYTTFFKEMTSQIVSRTKVVSNVVTGTINLNQAIQKRSTEYAASPQDIMPEGAENLPIVITPVTEYATSTFYTTFFVPGQGSTVVTNIQTLSKVYLPEFSEVNRHRQTAATTIRPTTIARSSQGRLTSSRSDQITRLINGLPVLENGDLLLSSTESARTAERYSEEPEAELIKPTVTRKRIVVTRTRSLPNADSLSGLPRRSTVVVRGPPRSLSDVNTAPVFTEDPHEHQLGRLHPSVTPTPVTFYTTYTYFTTELVNGSPVVHSNEHLFSTVITGKVLPTRVQPTLQHQRVKRTVAVEPSVGGNELAEEFTDNKIDNKSAKIIKAKSTGVVSEVISKSGIHTVVTQIIGTLINGFYAQFAVTKTLEPRQMLATAADNIETNNQVDQSETAEVPSTTENTTEVETQTQTEAAMAAETTTAMSSEAAAAATTTESNTGNEEVTTMLNSIEESIESILNDTEKSTLTDKSGSNSTEMEKSKVESSIFASHAGNVSASSPLDRKTKSSTEAEANSPAVSSLPLLPSVSFLSDTISTIVSSNSSTPTLSASLSSSSPSVSETVKPDYRTGLIFSTVESITAGNQMTRITREVFGTYIAGIYAHLAKTRSDIVGLSTSASTTTQTHLTTPTPTASFSLPASSASSGSASSSVTGVKSLASPSTLSASFPSASTLLWPTQSVSMSASPISTEGVTSLLEVRSRSDNDTLEESSAIAPSTTWSMLPGLSTVSLSTETVNQTILVHTTEYYTTEINGFTAHYSRSTSNIAGTIEPTSSSVTSRPSVHFPTPVRFLFSTKYPEALKPVYTTSSNIIEPPRTSRKYKELYGNEHDYYDEPYPQPSVGHLPRSRIIREKDSQPVVEYEYDLDYADNSEQSNSPEQPKPTPSYASEAHYQPSTYGQVNQRAQQQARTYNSMSYGATRRGSSGFGARVRAGGGAQERAPFEQPIPAPVRIVEEHTAQPVQPRSRQSNGGRQAAAGTANRRRQPSRTAASPPSPTRSLDYYNINDYSSSSRYQPAMEDVRGSTSLAPNRNEANGATEYRRPINRQRQLSRQRRPYSSTTTTTTTTTPAPRNYALLPSQRLRLNRKYNNNNNNNNNRNRMHETTTSNIRMQTMEHDLNRERSEVHKERVRYRGPSKPANFRQYGQQPSRQTAPPRETYPEMYSANTVYSTPTVPKVPLTVTSIVTTVKTVPIFHGFKTSYATLTTTTLSTSVIPQSLYETSVNEDGLTQTLFTRVTDSVEPNKVTEVLVTTSALQEVKLVPIKFGYSTRTETLTDVKTFTMLTTSVHTRSQELQLPPPPGSSLLTTVTTFVTTQTLSSTTAVSLLLHGKTLVSTLTFTSLTEATITKTETLTVAVAPTAAPGAGIHPQPLVTLLTLSITGDNGEVTELVTALTVPVQQMLHTKVERDVKPTSSFSLDEHRHRSPPPALSPPQRNHIVLESSTSAPHLIHNNYLSASFKTVDQYSETHPFFITTIFKGPNTEIYEAQATKVTGESGGSSGNADNDDSPPVVFRKRKLHQFNDNLYKEPLPILTADGNFESERNGGINSKPQAGARKPSFQRIRIKSRPNAPKSPSESRLSEFSRVVGLSDGSFAASSSANSFRRLPISREPQQQNVYSSAPSSVYSFPSSSATYLLANNFQKPTFRKVKPANNRRIVSSIRTVQPIIVSSVIQPSQVFASSLHNFNSNFMEVAKPPNSGSNSRPNVHNAAAFQSQASHLQPELQHLRPEHHHRQPVNVNTRNRFNSVDGLEAFDPNGHRNEFSDNYIGNLRVPSAAIGLFATQPALEPSVHTPTIPLTYYTTFTYLTTVIRGPHTAHLSRESVTSAVTTRALDKSIVEVVRDNDGVIEPTKVLQLGVKTKGFTTTVYNAVSQVQIYNEDLYNVIQKTYNKNIQFKPWQSSSAYQPVFLTNHVEPQRESSRVWPPLSSADVDFSSPLAVNPNKVNPELSSASQIEASPPRGNHFDFSTASIHLVTPLLSSSEEVVGHSHGDPLVSVSRTPTIEETALLVASPVASRPVRISSSVLVRKPSNSKYAYLYTRSRLRVRVKGTNSDNSEDSSAVPNSAAINTSPLFTSSETYEIESTQVAAEQTTPSLKPGRIRTTKSKIVFRPRNSNAVLSTNNPNVIRVSSRVFRPSVTTDPLSSSVILVDSPENLPLDEASAGNSFEPEQPTLDSIAHSDNGRANKFTRVSNGVTLIISSKVATQNRPFTLEPTLVTGAAVMMKPIDPSAPPMPDMSNPMEPRKQYNTFTYHTTYTQGDKTYVSSSKATVEKESIQPSTTTETVQVLKTSTLYSTLTYFATLFNGSASTITPIEDVKTEYITFPESTVVTRTIEPTRPSDADLITQTHFTTYTNLATVFSDSKPVVSTLHEVVSSEVVLSKSRSNTQYSMPVSVTSSSQTVKPSRTTTRSTHTTLTHFITLFSGTHTILSSIEEISPTVVTEVVGQSSTSSSSEHRLNMPHIRFTQPSADPAKQTKNRYGGLVPSVSTLFTTHTYYTTLFSGTTSVIQSREETTHSLVTLYVHSTVAAIQPTSTATGIEPSVRFESSTIVPASSSYVPDIVESSELQLEPSSAFPEAASSATPSIGDESAIVFFTNFILPSSVTETENTIDQAKGPLMNHGQFSTQGGATLIKPDQATKPLEMPPVTLVQDAVGQPSTTQGNNTIKPGAIIELSDLLDGANLAGNLGDAIKDIVQILSKGQKSKVPLAGGEIDRTSAVQEMPPKEGATVSHLDNPVYIPMYPANSESRPETTSSLEIPPVAYVPAISSPSIAPTTTQLRSMAVMPTFIWSGELPPAPSSSISTSSSSSLPKLFSRSSTFVRAPVEVAPTLLSSTGEEKTLYYTSVEATPTTVVLTTTKVYYTRDAPLTITSEYVSTLPPKTIITTVAGSKTAINTYSSEITATSTQRQPAITAVHSVSSKPETSSRPIRPTRKPGVNRFKPPTRPTEGPKIFKTSHRPRAPYKPSPTPPPEFVPEDSGKGTFKKTTKAFMPKTTTRPSILDLDQCKPACNAANKEICKEFAGKFKCGCRPGYTKKLGSDTCHELQNFIVLVRVTKLGESDVVWQSDLMNRTSDQYMNLAKAARAQLDGAHVTDELKDNYISSDVMSIDQATDGNGVLVNMTIHLTESGNLDEDLLKEKLARTLEKSSEQLPSPSQIYADLEDVVDFDECSSEEYNDCASSARCINELGTYKCECLNGYPDLDPGNPGRMCSSEIKACEFCNGRGDCFRDETGQISSCKCHRMYLGRRCDINGLLLAIFIPIFAILCILSICLVAYCCRKWRNRTLTKGFRNLSAYGPTMIGNTLDRKAMIDTSSDNSDPLRSHLSYEGQGMTSTEATLPRDYRRRRESELSSDRSFTSIQAATAANYNFSPQFMIPRVRNTTTTPAVNSHYGHSSSHHQQGHYGRSHHRHSHHQIGGGGGSSGHLNKQTGRGEHIAHCHHQNDHHQSGHSHHHHSHHGSSYDLHYNEHPSNQRGHHSYMW